MAPDEGATGKAHCAGATRADSSRRNRIGVEAKSRCAGRTCTLRGRRSGRRDAPVRGLTGQTKGKALEKTGRKNAAGGWLRVEFFRRIASAGMLGMVAMGCALGFVVRGLPVFDGPAGAYRIVGGDGRDVSGIWRALRVLPPGRGDMGAGSGSGTPDRRSHRPCRRAARLRGRA